MSVPNKITQFPVGPSLSWVLTAIVAASCLLLAPILIRAIPIYSDMFQGFEVQLPWPTHALFATYYWLLPSFFVALAVFVIWKKCSTCQLRRRFLLTARFSFVALITMGIVIFVLYLPLLALASKLGIAK